jgi:hypothetical protein
LRRIGLDESIRLKDAIADLSFRQAVEASAPYLLFSRQRG